MKRSIVCILAFALGAAGAAAQSLDDLNIQIHGYATQGFLYTTQNNILTTNSSNGSPAWTEAVINISSQPIPKLRIGVQGRYFLLGNYGNAVTLDWAAADYKANEKLGVRFGKVKTPIGLLNEIQDIDPAYLWSLLPQSIYPISSRNSILATYGGVVYGTVSLQKAGKLEYRGWGGEDAIGAGDGYFVTFREGGITFPNGASFVAYGSSLHWKTPLPGLMLGGTVNVSPKNSSPIVSTFVVPSGPGAGTTITTPGNFQLARQNTPYFFGRYEKDRLMVAAEYQRTVSNYTLQGLSPYAIPFDIRAWYAMGSYKLTSKLNAGVYTSQYFSRKTALGPGRYTKDWALSARYDFNQYLYAKAEQHFIDGTAIGYDTSLNPNGLKPDTRLSILKIGVSF